MVSFLQHHFNRFMNAYKDGRLNELQVEDLTLPLPRGDEERAAAAYCIANDLDDERVPELLEAWRKHRAAEPPPMPPNVILAQE